MQKTVNILLLSDKAQAQNLLIRPAYDPGDLVLNFTYATDLTRAAEQVAKTCPDLIMLDLEMPCAPGTDAFFTIKAMAPETAIVVLSGAQGKEAGIRAMDLGAQDWFIKGEDTPERLFSVVRHVMNRREILDVMLELDLELSRATTRLQELARTDPLTQLNNRRGLQEALFVEGGMLETPADPTLVMLLNIDDFSAVNEEHGHEAGDQVLMQVAKLLKQDLPAEDCAARVAGDEFVLLMPNTHPAKGLAVAERLRDAISELAFRVPKGHVKLTMSIGLIVLPREPTSVERLLALSHGTLQRSKHDGKNRVSAEWKPGPTVA